MIFVFTVLIRLNGHDQMSQTTDEQNNLRRGREVIKLLTSLFKGEFDPNDWYFIRPGYPTGPAIPVAYIIGITRGFRVPFILIGGLTCVVLYLLAKDLFDTRTALISSLLLALEPFHVSLSHIVGVDSVTTFFTLVTLWAFLRGLKTQRRIWWGISAIAMGMGTLTKLQTVIVVPILLTWMFFFSEHEHYRQTLKDALRLLVPYCTLALMTFYVLWPWLWPNPFSRTLDWLNVLYYDVTTIGHTTFYLGRSTPHPGWSFYPVVLIFKLTAPEFLGIAFFLIFLLRDRPSGPLWNKKNEILALISWILLYVLFMTLIPMKLGARYVLPIFPAVLIFSTLGWISLLDRLSFFILGLPKNIPKKLQARQVQLLFGLVLLSAQAYPLFIEAPDYYYDYFNPLLGGSKTAVRVVSIGWGEGMNKIADYIEDQEANDDLPPVIVIGYESLFNKYYDGPKSPKTSKIHKSEDISLEYVLDNFDYIVFQLNYVQRQFHEDIWIYFSKFTPEFTLEAYGVTLFWVFRISPEMK